MHSCTWKKVPAPTSCATTVFDVFAARADLSAGSYTIEHDLGVNEQRSLTVLIDVEELADTSFHARGYVRETETDEWQELNGVGSNAVDTNASFMLEGVFRYARIVVTTTGSAEFESGIAGY